jgi:hypothetical protein
MNTPETPTTSGLVQDLAAALRRAAPTEGATPDARPWLLLGAGYVMAFRQAAQPGLIIPGFVPVLSGLLHSSALPDLARLLSLAGEQKPDLMALVAGTVVHVASCPCDACRKFRADLVQHRDQLAAIEVHLVPLGVFPSAPPPSCGPN